MLLKYALLFFSGRALARIGNAHLKNGNLDEALVFFQKSLAEHRSSDVVKKTQEVR